MNTNLPEWLRAFGSNCLGGLLESALMGGHYFHNIPDQEWEVSLFELPTEIHGGADDGMQAPSRLQIDVGAIALVFDSPPKIYWQAEKISDNDELGSHLSFEGTVCGFRVWLRILQHSPFSLGLERGVAASNDRGEDIW